MSIIDTNHISTAKPLRDVDELTLVFLLDTWLTYTLNGVTLCDHLLDVVRKSLLGLGMTASVVFEELGENCMVMLVRLSCKGVPFAVVRFDEPHRIRKVDAATDTQSNRWIDCTPYSRGVKGVFPLDRHMGSRLLQHVFGEMEAYSDATHLARCSSMSNKDCLEHAGMGENFGVDDNGILGRMGLTALATLQGSWGDALTVNRREDGVLTSCGKVVVTPSDGLDYIMSIVSMIKGDDNFPGMSPSGHVTLTTDAGTLAWDMASDACTMVTQAAPLHVTIMPDTSDKTYGRTFAVACEAMVRKAIGMPW